MKIPLKIIIFVLLVIINAIVMSFITKGIEPGLAIFINFAEGLVFGCVVTGILIAI